MAREKIFFDWIKPNSLVLDIGCGNSRLLYELKNEKNCQVLGTDVSSVAVSYLKEQGVDEVLLEGVSDEELMDLVSEVEIKE